MALFGDMPTGWRLHNVSLNGTPSWVKTFDIRIAIKCGYVNQEVEIKRKVLIGKDPFSGLWFWCTTGTARDSGVEGDVQMEDPVACAAHCELTFGDGRVYEGVKRRGEWQPGNW